MKKVFLALFVILLCVSPVFATGSKEAATTSTPQSSPKNVWDGDPVDLKMMVFPATANYERINANFLAANPEIDRKVNIEVQLGGSGDGDVAQKLRLALASGQNIPDLIRLNYTQLPEFAEAGVLEDISAYIKPYEDSIIDAAKTVMQYKGTYYAFPREIKPKVWFYRKDIFDAVGIDPYQVKTLDEFIAAGEKIQAKYPNAHMENFNIPARSYDLMMLLSGTDGSFCSEKGEYDLASDPDVKLTFERIKKLNTSKVNSTVAEWSADWKPAFNSGELVSQLIGGWFKTDFMNFGLTEQQGKWAIAPWPEEIRYGSDAGGAIWVVPKASKNKEVAASYIAKLCFDLDASKIIFDETGIIPALKTAKDDPYFNAPHKFYATSLGPVNFETLGYLKVYPFTPASTQEITIALQYLDEYLKGKMTVDEALAAAQKDMINQIGNPFK
ncbi:carbohydrate ABC transporter substrate-binding protein, CUT1 family [Sphaerochaeta associata]|uniref:Extracellular solute-binding protein n=1 Tax=Sphaerochaeta associata TaxID=1129264 RepID=A0ABY4DCN9_9SPIR|nr:extracellular solute-binding protein [Sphaerochaeta associata]UOM52024.1 extracellular solute-binding protein [Sphaerochaeta associata]SMP59610.1 carbohydrate ABC transporter substrate-binding protein, CUT1 family [Sphaerochaeta associata]